MESVEMKVQGMTCNGCVASVTRVLKAIPGVERADVTLTPGAAKVSFDPGRTSASALRQAIEGAGFDVVA